ncbi:MAG: hypothetical protein PUC82_00015 [bacterium]|nr:hypothetical protein [bacterium]
MKKLPKVFQNEISKNINNNKKVCYLKEENKNVSDPITSNQTITDTLDEIFSGLGYSYNIPVIIKTKTKTYDTSLITKSRINIITIDNEVIPISDIISINIKKNTQ